MLDNELPHPVSPLSIILNIAGSNRRAIEPEYFTYRKFVLYILTVDEEAQEIRMGII